MAINSTVPLHEILILVDQYFYVTLRLATLLGPYWPYKCLIRVLGVRTVQPWKDLIKTFLLSSLCTFQTNKIILQFHPWNIYSLLDQKQWLLLSPLLYQLTKLTEICFHHCSQQNLHMFNTELCSVLGQPLFRLQREFIPCSHTALHLL